MRFDDSLKTVLSAEAATGFGAQSTWRQLVDLLGRRRIAIDETVIARLRLLRQAVPTDVRAASARALAFASPPAPLVGLFAEDELAIAAPVLRTATLDAEEWEALLPRLSPAGRSVLRGRRDLPAETVRGLESFGSVDFVLHYEPANDVGTPPPPMAAITEEPAVAEPMVLDAPLSETPFVTLGDITRGLPVVAEALRQAEEPAPQAVDQPARFEIAELVARIEAFNRHRTETRPETAVQQARDNFRFETDAGGTIIWVEGIARPAVIGLTFAHAGAQGQAQFDAAAAGAFRRRSAFTDARLEIGGSGEATGSWRLSATPGFDDHTGRFVGYTGAARRPRPDEVAGPRPVVGSPASESLRQLVHELRTPTNAIAGFAELIETELLGPVPPVYRDRAVAIRTQATALIGAIEDLDTAARIEGDALDLRETTVATLPMLARVIADLGPLASLRGATVGVEPASADRLILADDRAVERLLGRLMAALVSRAGRGERIGIAVSDVPFDVVCIVIDRPIALDAHQGEALLSLDSDAEEAEGAPLLGTGFALRLAQNLALELGGGLTIDRDRLMLRLPAAVDGAAELASR